jgi:signal transduction histidine kinase
MLPISMDDEIKVLLFRSVRELMLNIVKHAQARNARVTIRREGDDVSIAVEDDGVGMKDLRQDPRLKSNGGFGLFSIRERLRYLGGQVQVEPGNGRGTRVTLVVPLQHAKKAYAGTAT